MSQHHHSPPPGKNGKLSAERQTLIESHIGLARAMAKRAARLFPPSIDVEDLIGEANVGLVMAARRYDPERFPNVTFGAFARKKVWGAIFQHNRRSHYKNATHAELKETDLAPEVPRVDEVIERREKCAHVAAAVAKLPHEEREVFTRYYCRGLTMRQIGDEMDLSESRISQLHGQAVREVRHRCRRLKTSRRS